MDKPQIILHVQKSLNYTVFDGQWIPETTKFAIIGSQPKGEGVISIYEMENVDAVLVHEVNKPVSFRCSSFGASAVGNQHLATGDFNGTLNIWDMERLDSPVYSVKAHQEIINMVDGVGGVGIGVGAAEIATCSRDGSVKIWDPRQPDLPVASMEPSPTEKRRDCWALAFGNSYNESDRCMCAGFDNGDIKLFDFRAMALRWETNVKNGVCCLEFDRKDIAMNKLAVTTLESKFHIFDMRTESAKSNNFAYLTETAHKSTLWTIRHLPQNREIFMTSGGSGSLYLWKYVYPKNRIIDDGKGNTTGCAGSVDLLQNVTLATQPIASFQWCREMEGLALATSFDQSFRICVVTKLSAIH